MYLSGRKDNLNLLSISKMCNTEVEINIENRRHVSWNFNDFNFDLQIFYYLSLFLFNRLIFIKREIGRKLIKNVNRYDNNRKRNENRS